MTFVTAHAEVAKRPTVQQILSAEGDRRLPLILVNEAVVSRGPHLSRAQLAAHSDRDRVGSVRSPDEMVSGRRHL